MSTTGDEGRSDDFKLKVATEAHFSTPRGGYPEVAAKYGIEPKRVFDWVREFFPPAPPPFSAVHVWIGMTTKSREAFEDYFARRKADSGDDKLGGRDALHADETTCGFCVDLGRKHFYDPDLIYLQYFTSPVSVMEAVNELPLSTSSAEANILKACENRGLSLVNAVISYADPAQVIRDPDKLYSGLIYLGLFKDRDAES